MSYTSQVFVAIGGRKSALEALVRIFKPFAKPEEKLIFSGFRFIQVAEGSWIYAFHDNNIVWDEDAENVFHVIRQNCKNFEFSYVFYRLGDDLTDIEVDEFCSEKGKTYYSSLVNLTNFNRSINVDERILSALHN